MWELLCVAVRNLQISLDLRCLSTHHPIQCNFAVDSFAALPLSTFIHSLTPALYFFPGFPSFASFCPPPAVFIAQHRASSSPSFLSTSYSLHLEAISCSGAFIPSFDCQFGLVSCTRIHIETNNDTCDLAPTPDPRYPLD